LKKMVFELNKEGIPFYALEKYNNATEWAKNQMKICIPELESCGEMRKKLAGQFLVFREGISPHIFENPHDVIIESVNAKKEVVSVQIGVSDMGSFVETQPLRGVSMTFIGGTIFHPYCDYRLDRQALHVNLSSFLVRPLIMLCVSGSRGNICRRQKRGQWHEIIVLLQVSLRYWLQQHWDLSGDVGCKG